jgi:hypothetical protein
MGAEARSTDKDREIHCFKVAIKGKTYQTDSQLYTSYMHFKLENARGGAVAP